MTGMSDEAVKAATGRDWGAWRSFLDASGAAEKSHKQIALDLHAAGVPGWWAQMVTVGYERMIGRRAVGQRCDGAFSASASRTIPGDKDAALARWLAVIGDRAEYDDVLAEGEPRVTSSANWRYWKVDLEDGSRVSVTIYDKAGKASIGIGHEKLADAEAVARWKLWWKAALAEV